MRFLSQSTEFNVSGADINQDNVSWCQSNLPAVRTIQTSALPPFAFVANEFDLVFAISVFTHLPKVAMFAWLDEISRVTVSGGVVILTTHGDAVLDTITKSPQHQKMFRMSSEDASSMKAKFSSDGFVYNSYDADGLRVAKAGSDYGTSFTHEKFIRSQWNRDALSVIEFLPGGLRGGQDIVILKKA
jgi:cyclopropane fatty-acyl-phospholipid synthase-like methyltransferase